MSRMRYWNIPFPDPLRQAVMDEARAASEERGRRVSASEWVREACEQRLAREKRKGR